MSVDEAKSGRVALPPSALKLVQYDAYIDKQIQSTRRRVKAVDFATALVLLATGVLAYLLAVALVEHWLLPGGFPLVARVGLFLLLVGGAGYFARRRLWPLCARAINPVYAAHTIEQGSPSLKNSLINLLLFRQRRSEISEAVYRTLEEQAAQRLTRVPIDTAVDSSQLIRFGYVLLGVMAVAALYKAFSPKDPLIAAGRVLMPWADIAPASRVAITGVEPGHVTVTRGEFVDVSAEVRGIGENDPVVLRFTTADGQAVDKAIPLKLTNSGLRFAGRLPEASQASGAAGVAQNLTYRIEAGDARTLDYRVTVVSAPAILVERVDYDYPDYTGYVDRSVGELGDIRGIEGTRVTIHARANGPIDEAHVDFDADGRRDLAMRVDGQRATASFELALRDDRQTARHASYMLRFTNAEGRSNRDPAKYPIDVQPDYAPEVAILSPPEKSLDVRLDETVVIEIEASDPDFALADVRLEGETAGRPKIDVRLLDRPHRGRFTARHRFTPRDHGLRANDIVRYRVTATDIRTPKGNTTSTEERIFRITSPDPAQPPPDRIAQRDRQQQPGGQPGQPGQQQESEGQPGEQGAGGNQGGRNSEQRPNESDQPGDRQQQQNGGQQGHDQVGQQGPSQGAPQEGESASADAKNSGGGSSSKSGSENVATRSENQHGESQEGGEGSSQGARPKGDRSGQPRPSQGARGEELDGGSSESTPVSPEGDDDGAAFERIREHLARRGELKEAPSQSAEENRQRPGDSSAADNSKSRQPEATESQQPAGRDAAQSDGEAQPGADKTDSRQDDGVGKPQSAGAERKPADDAAGRADDKGRGAGAEPRQDDSAVDEQPPSGGGEKARSPGGEQTSTKGPSGAGEQPGENEGSPDSAQEMRPGEKRDQSASPQSRQDDREPPAPGEGKRESDSQGEMGGDRPGGGEEGGGQKADREGTGSAGQNQSADEGAGESSEQGGGHASPNAGQDAQSQHKTGQPGGDEQGRGSRERAGEGRQPGDESGGESGEKTPGADDGKTHGKDDPARAEEKTAPQRGGEQSANEPAAADGRPAGGQQRDSSAEQPGHAGAPTGDGGHTGTNTAAPAGSGGTAPDGDAANLEYARKQTDLVLEKLADQLKRQRVDEELLKELGWTKDDLRAFVERWQRRKAAARRDDPSADAARRELDEALRSLGLRRGALRQSDVVEDRQRDLREGYRGPVPPEYQERLRAYNEAISRARAEGGKE